MEIPIFFEFFTDPLSIGYANDVTEIMKYLPKICQGFLMSATLSPELNALKKVVLHSPAVLKLEEEDNALTKKRKEGNLTQFYLALPKNDKRLVIYVFLKVSLKQFLFCYILYFSWF